MMIDCSITTIAFMQQILGTISQDSKRALFKHLDRKLKKSWINKLIPKYFNPTGRPLLLGELDNMTQVYLRAVSSCDAAINTNIAKATTKAAIQKYPDLICNIDSLSWGKSLFKKMRFFKHAKISYKGKYPWRCQKKIEYLSHHEIAAMVALIILIIDQTPLKYISIESFTFPKKGAKSVSSNKIVSTPSLCIIFSWVGVEPSIKFWKKWGGLDRQDLKC